MIKTNKDHKKVDISNIRKIITKRLIPAFISGVLIGTVVDFGIINNISALKTSYTIENNSTQAEFEYLDNLDFLLDYPNLRHLTIRNSTITDLSAISKLKKLKTLTITSSNLSESSISSDSLETLNIINTVAIIDYNLPNLKNLNIDTQDKYVDLYKINSDKLENISLDSLTNFDNDIFYCKSLKSLTLCSVNVGDFDTTKINENIEVLMLSDININDINIQELNKLREMYLLNIDLNNYEFIKKANNLETLVLIYSNFNDTSILKDLKKLKGLNITGTKIKNLNDLPENIEYLDISHLDSIEDISNIKNLKRLKTLSMTGVEYMLDDNLYEYIKNRHIKHSITKEELHILDRYQKIVDYIINDDMNDFDKVNAIINFCVNQIEYDITLIDDPNILNNAINGKGVCQAYADMAVILGKLAGVDIKNIYSPGHVWNVCKIYDNYYTFDATWISRNDLMYSNAKKLLHSLTPIAELKYHNGNDYYSKPYIEPYKIIPKKETGIITKKWIGNGLILPDSINKEEVTKEELINIIYKLTSKNIEINSDKVYVKDFLSILNDLLNENNITIYDEQELTYSTLIILLEALVGNFYNSEGIYYINGGNAFISSDNITLQGVCNTLYLNENCKNININKLVYKEIKYINNKDKTI